MCFLKVLLLLFISVGFPSRGQSACCDPGWLQFGDYCFFFNHDAEGKATWRKASQACQALGGRLADIRNEAEWNFVRVHLRTPSQYMIGITDEQTENEWKFLDGSDAFVKWEKTQPDHNVENCGSLLPLSEGYYNNILCEPNQASNLPADFGTFICKKAAK